MARAHLTSRETIHRVGQNQAADERVAAKLADFDHALDKAEAYVLADVANSFDPSSSGLAGRVGAMVGTIDGTKSWIKTGATSTDWTPVHSA
jgi:uncharacterized protein (DUF2235 family)